MPWQILVYVAAGSVVLVLFAGLFNLFRGGPPNLSQKLMRGRILLQLITVIIVMAALYFTQTAASG